VPPGLISIGGFMNSSTLTTSVGAMGSAAVIGQQSLSGGAQGLLNIPQ
jgi:hypothetical protein